MVRKRISEPKPNSRRLNNLMVLESFWDIHLTPVLLLMILATITLTALLA
jgi:hypothetical protein